MGHKITGTVNSTVILGKGGYRSPPRITSTGAIEPAAGSGDAGVNLTPRPKEKSSYFCKEKEP
jgi:hypothetical protein